jgi:esterase/lipase superfamily enzyme
MNREFHAWYSPRLGRTMELLVFGHAGARVIVFPSSMGKFFEWEDRGMVRALGHAIGSGHIQLYCVDSVDQESWYAKWKHPHGRAQRHDEFDRYLMQEVIPFSEWKNPNPFLIATGASFGGYHALDFGLRHPEKVRRILAMSALADIRRFTDGYWDHTTYFHNPVEFLANEHDQRRLDELRWCDVIMAVGREDPLLASNQALSDVLWRKGIWNALRVWDGMAHDWPYWEKMLHQYLSGSD